MYYYFFNDNANINQINNLYLKMSSKPSYLCEAHQKKYVGYCETCSLNICLLCTSKHEKHELLQYNEIQPTEKKVEEIKKNLIKYKKDNKVLKEKIDLWLEKVNYYTNRIKEILENNEKVYEEVISNYDTNNLIYADIDNINQIRKKGLILGYKHIDLSLFSTDDKILEKSEIILKAIKEMQIEDIFYSIKEQKNLVGNLEIIKNKGEKTTEEIEKEKERKDKEDKDANKKDGKKKKVVKKKVKKENNKETEAELTRKKYEDFKEVNLKSKLFDDEYLINLEKKPAQDNAQNNDSSSPLFKSVNNRREINHSCKISFGDKKYIATTGYCYINLFDLKGDLQRSIKIHDSDITYLIQLKNGDLLTCCIDGTMKIIRLGKNEGYSVLQTIDTSKIEKENKNSIFSNNQLYVLLQIKSNENIVTVHGSNLLFFKQTKDNKDLYEFDYLLPTNDKKENDYDIICNNCSISSLIEVNNDNFIGLNHNSILFFEKEKDKYILKSDIKNICGSGGPNNVIYLDNKILIGGGDNLYVVDIVEKKILNEIKINCCGINCIDTNLKNDLLYIGYESKEHEFDMSENSLLIDKEKGLKIEEKRVIKKAHSNSISNIVSLEENENDNSQFNFYSLIFIIILIFF